MPETYHTAVWTGTEMIVWGGINGSSYLNTGGRYNPGTDSWTATSTTNAPDARHVSHGSVDRQRNDRLGRIQQQLFEHRRAILRGYTNRNANTNSYPNPNSNGYGNSNGYCEAQSDSAASPDAGAAPVDARVDRHRNKTNHGFR